MQQKITKHLALNTMTIKIGGSATKIFAKRDKKNRMIVTVSEIKALLKNVKASGVINTSLFVDAIEAGVPPSIIVGLISEYSFDVDFQRDIRKGDSFVIVYEEYYDEEDIKIKDGSLLYGSLVLRGKQYEMYNFMGNFYDSKGHENKKELLKTPVDGARISGFFGMRKHPILGFTRAHQGIDFAVPKGTPVKAAGNGVVEFVGRRGGYGNLISIRHGSEYKTNYAHLSAFRRGIQKGSKVNQGTVIGYVGSTGLATGPHLHYEVEKFGKKINPRKMIVKSSKKLSEALMPNFNQQIKRIKRFVNKNKDGKYDQEFSD